MREERRRRGYKRAIVETAIQVASQHGATAVGLNVFGHNTGARARYEQLGSHVVSIQMKLAL